MIRVQDDGVLAATRQFDIPVVRFDHGLQGEHAGWGTFEKLLDRTWVKPIYLSRHDALTADTARQILVHNETGAERCNWKRVKK